MALWMPPVVSYVAMASSTETTASTSTVGMTPSRYPTPELPPLEPMDTSPPLTTEQLLLMAGIGRGTRGWTPPWIPTAPGPRQPRPRTPHSQVPAPGRQGATAQTPYQQQVFPPPTPAPRQSATPSASQSQSQRPASKETGTRGRSLSQGPRDRQRAPRSSTRDSRKSRCGAPDDDLMDEMVNYVASGWKRDLIHMIGCCWVAQEGPLEGEEWWVAIEKFISVMVKKKREWTEVKELTPLKYMPYMAKLFREVTGKDLQSLGQFTGWIGLGGYYHWRVVQQGLIHQVPRLQDEPIPRMPNSHPSGRALPARPSSAGTLAAGDLAGPPGGAQPTPQGGGSRPASNQEGGPRPAPSQGGGQRPASNQRGSASTPSQSGGPPASSRGGRSSAPHRGATPATSGGSANLPSGGQGAGDSAWANWYQLTLQESGGRISEPQGPPFPITSAQMRWEAVGQIYGRVHGKEPPGSNVLSKALQAYYSQVDLPTLHTWACQALCMIAEYHMACVA